MAAASSTLRVKLPWFMVGLEVPARMPCCAVQLLLAPLGALAQGVQATLIVRLYRASAAPAAVSAAAPSASSSEGQQRTDRSPFSHPSARGALNVLATGTTMGGLWCALAMIGLGVAPPVFPISRGGRRQESDWSDEELVQVAERYEDRPVF